MDDLQEIFTELSHVLETAATMSDLLKGRSYVIHGLEALRERMKISASSGRKSDGRNFRIEPILTLQLTVTISGSVLRLRNASDATTAYTQVLHVPLGKR